jgi:lipopolysaccharide biosynthesis glycosyltransferase
MIPIYVGFDPRETAAYHVFCQSVIRHSSRPVTFTPLALNLLRRDYEETHTDGSNAFIYSRFLIPHLQGYKGWAIFCDGDMLCRADIKELWSMRDDSYGVLVAKHNYKTKHKQKYLGSDMQTINVDYPRKNWSSVMLINCEYPENRILTPGYVMGSTGSKLHRFEHLRDEDIGSIPLEWNWLVGEYEHDPDAKLVHYTLGVPAIQAYADCDHAKEWFETLYEARSITA